MSVTLTSTARAEAQGFILDLFAGGGVIDRSTVEQFKNGRWSRLSQANRGYYYAGAVKRICNTIVDRTFDFTSTQFEKDLDTLAEVKFKANVKDTGSRDSGIKRPKEVLVNYIAWFCKTNGIFWDDVHDLTRTKYDVETEKNSTFGKALYEFECMLSQQQATQTSTSSQQTSATTSSTTTTRQPSTRQPGQAPKNPYKSLGPLSGKARALIGQPGKKLQANSRSVYKIVANGNTTGGKEIRAYVNPINQGSKYEINGVNKVLIGSSTGYSDMTCWFDDINDANAFAGKLMNAIQAAIAAGQTLGYNSLSVVRSGADSNGYYLVNTNCGACAVAAIKLNEEVETDTASLTEAEEHKASLKRDVDNYLSALYSY